MGSVNEHVTVLSRRMSVLVHPGSGEVGKRPGDLISGGGEGGRDRQSWKVLLKQLCLRFISKHFKTFYKICQLVCYNRF